MRVFKNGNFGDFESELIEIIYIQIAHTSKLVFSLYQVMEFEKNKWFVLDRKSNASWYRYFMFFPIFDVSSGWSWGTQQIRQPNKILRNKFKRLFIWPKSTAGSHFTELSFSKDIRKAPFSKNIVHDIFNRIFCSRRGRISRSVAR